MEDIIPFLISLFPVFLFSFILTDLMIPLIIKVVRQNSLSVEPNERSSHVKKTPTLGGISFYISIICGIFLINLFDFKENNNQLTIAITILFFLGLIDDIKPLSAKVKIFFQSLSIFIILLDSGLWVSTFHGFLGIYQIPFWIGITISYLLVLFFINAYNLIDGIDGLAGMIGIYISIVFALFYFFIGMYYDALLAIIIIGFLVAFLKYNLSDNKKIFMGDTGSMIVGFLLGYLALRFLSLNIVQIYAIKIEPVNLILVLVTLFFIPIFDVLRVIFIRSFNKQKLFRADRSHIHHLFIDKGLKHKKASVTITSLNIIFFILIYSINFFTTHSLLVFSFIILLSFFLFLMLILGTDRFSKSFRKKIKSKVPKWIYKVEFQFRKLSILFLKNLFYNELL